MRTRVRWTNDLDEQLRGLRASGLTWDSVALAMAMGATRCWSAAAGLARGGWRSLWRS